jgi:hypothetical protein
MATFKQLPAVMNLAFKAGDAVSPTVDFDTSLTGLTVSAQVYSLVDRRKIYDIPVVVSNATSGVVTMSISSSLTTQTPAGSYGWQMQWSSPLRTVMAGTVDVIG